MLLTTFSLIVKGNDIYRIEMEQVNIRENPNARSKVVCTISFGENVQVLDSTDAIWYKVKANDFTGYVDSRLLSKVSDEELQMQSNVNYLKGFVVTFFSILLILGIYLMFVGDSKNNVQHVVNSQNQYFIIKGKSVGLAILLAVIFGPFGMLYATKRGAGTMLVLPIISCAILLFAAGQNLISCACPVLSIGSLYCMDF